MLYLYDRFVVKYVDCNLDECGLVECNLVECGLVECGLVERHLVECGLGSVIW